MPAPEPMPGQPHAGGELVFDAPWQARTFALAVQLNQAGLFEWKEWTAKLAGNIAEFEKRGTIADSDAYYQRWHETLEQIVREKTASRRPAASGRES